MVIVWHIRNPELLLLGQADGWMGGWLDKCYEIEIFGESYRQPCWGRPSQWMRQSADRESTSRDDGGGKATGLWWRYYILWEILISQHRYLHSWWFCFQSGIHFNVVFAIIFIIILIGAVLIKIIIIFRATFAQYHELCRAIFYNDTGRDNLQLFCCCCVVFMWELFTDPRAR